jgi:hypothetical protein
MCKITPHFRRSVAHISSISLEVMEQDMIFDMKYSMRGYYVCCCIANYIMIIVVFSYFLPNIDISWEPVLLRYYILLT